jgi:hypothetical protein
MNWFKSSSIWGCHTLWIILTLLFQKLIGFILVWKITFWVELFFMNTLGHCEWHIRMHTLLSCQNSLFDRQNFRSNLGQQMLGCKRAQSRFVISSFAWFLLEIFMNCSHIWEWLHWTKFLPKALNRYKIVVKKVYALQGWRCIETYTCFKSGLLVLKKNVW